MGRLITFVVGVLVGVALKWQYDQQSTSAPLSQTTEGTVTPNQPFATDIQEIAITVAEPSPSASTQPPMTSSENQATPPDVG
jgi:hypothetical protein